MKFPILTAVLILCLVIAYNNRKNKVYLAEEENNFWNREREANSTRRKPLDNLNYIQIPLETLPTDKHTDNDTIKSRIDTIVELSKSPIVNLTGISNTDLKLKYGAPNIDLLAQYDSRYTQLATSLNAWGKALYEINDYDAAKTVLEFAVSTDTDVSATYKTLGHIYVSEGNIDAVNKLISKVQSLNSLVAPSTIAYLTDLISQA